MCCGWGGGGGGGGGAERGREEMVGVWRRTVGRCGQRVGGAADLSPVARVVYTGSCGGAADTRRGGSEAYSEPAPINTESSSSLSSLAYANGASPSPHYERNSRDREYNQRGEYSYRDSGGGNTRDYSTSRNSCDSSGASVHINTSSTTSGKAAYVSNVLAVLDSGLGSRRAPAHSNSMSSGYTSTSGGYAAASSSYATSMTSGSPRRRRSAGRSRSAASRGSRKERGDGYSGTGTSSSYAPSAYSYSPGTGAVPYSPGGERAGFAGWNENGSPARGASANRSGSGLSRSGSSSGSAPVLANLNGNGASKFDLSEVDPNTFPMGDTGTVRRSHSPTPTTMTTRM
ncbi:hypothetical protein B0H14DRAFT_3157656 [Mycena olivaceomarginata]|nr:hypothetical protein B0H14DRAFT_3157656 [Mycena olivaceomarginata]